MNILNKIYIVYREFSHKKSTIFIENFFKSNFYNIINVSLNDVDFKDSLFDVVDGDIVFLSCGGRDINQILNYFNLKKVRPITISMFPGIVLKDQLDAFITRLACSYVLLNSKKDYEFYRKICNLFKRDFNGILFGASWYDPFGFQERNISNDIVFFEQHQVCSSLKERESLIEFLRSIAKNNRNSRLIIKGRGDNVDESIFRFLKNESNICFSNCSVGFLIGKYNKFLSVSSSAIIESILHGKKAYILSGFKKNKNYISFFEKSGFEVKSVNFDFNANFLTNKKWLDENIYSPEDGIVNLLSVLKKNNIYSKFDFFSPGIFKFYIKFPFLLFRNPKKTMCIIKRSIKILRSCGF